MWTPLVFSRPSNVGYVTSTWWEVIFVLFLKFISSPPLCHIYLDYSPPIWVVGTKCVLSKSKALLAFMIFMICYSKRRYISLSEAKVIKKVHTQTGRGTQRVGRDKLRFCLAVLSSFHPIYLSIRVYGLTSFFGLRGFTDEVPWQKTKTTWQVTTREQPSSYQPDLKLILDRARPSDRENDNGAASLACLRHSVWMGKQGSWHLQRRPIYNSNMWMM